MRASIRYPTNGDAMNTYTQHDGKHYVRDASGKEWECNVAHEMPLPAGIEQQNDRFSDIDECLIAYAGFATPDGVFWGDWVKGDTHWLARIPLPPVPRIKTQTEKDEEWITTMVKSFPCTLPLHQLLANTIAYARNSGQEVKP